MAARQPHRQVDRYRQTDRQIIDGKTSVSVLVQLKMAS